FNTPPPPFAVQNPRVDVIGATGVVRGFAGASGTSPTSLTDLYAAVNGRAPDGTAATGGLFWSCNSWFPTGAPPSGTYTERDNGMTAADKNLVWSVLTDGASTVSEARTCGTLAYARVIYAALRGGAQIYKTIDGGNTWAPSAGAGSDIIPAGADVYTIVL